MINNISQLGKITVLKKCLSFLGSMTIFLALTTALQAVETATDDAAKTVVAFHHALNSGDAKQARILLDDSVVIYEGGGVERSAEEYANHHLHADIEFMSKMQVTLLEHQVKTMGDMAVSMSRSKVQGKYQNKDIDIETMETMVLKKHDGNWHIMHIHWSN